MKRLHIIELAVICFVYWCYHSKLKTVMCFRFTKKNLEEVTDTATVKSKAVWAELTITFEQIKNTQVILMQLSFVVCVYFNCYYIFAFLIYLGWNVNWRYSCEVPDVLHQLSNVSPVENAFLSILELNSYFWDWLFVYTCICVCVCMCVCVCVCVKCVPT